MEERQPRKLAVILHADVVGSTTLVQQNETLAHERIQGVFRSFSETIKTYGGLAHELRGDALVAEFDRASDAVCAALTFQASNAEFNATLDDDIRPQLRMGISMGEVVVADNTVTGAGVVLAQRLEQLAEPGGVCIQGAAYETVPQRLPFRWESLSEQEVKGFDEPVRAYSVTLEPGHALPAPERHTRPKGKWFAVAAIGLFIIVAGGLAWLRPWAPTEEAASVERMAFPLPDKPAIAVLPFDNMSGDPEQEYFVDGMTEDLITDLSKVSGLFVIARHSTFAYKERSPGIRQVAKELGIRYVLEGSMRRSGDHIRINAQLIDATTGGHVWAERYDGTLTDVFALQDKVTEKIVAALAVNLTTQEQNIRAVKETDNPVAYDAFLQGWELYRRFTANDFVMAVPHFERAIQLDTNYGRASAAMASVYWESLRQGESWVVKVAPDSRGYGWSRVTARSRADDYLRLAMKNPSPLSHRLLSAMRWDHRQFDDAITEAERAVALDPNDPDGHVALAWALVFSGQSQEALAAVERAMRLDPRRPGAYAYVLGMIRFGLGQYESAATALQRAHETNPENRVLNLPLAAAYAKLGRLDQAQNALARYTDVTISSTTNVGLIMNWWPFRREVEIRRFGGALIKAGLCCAEHLEKYIARAQRGGTLQ